MCGIAGFIAEEIEVVPESARACLQEAIRYRGRDAEGTWSDGRRVHLAHTRLSIIDLKAGAQPMQDLSGRFVIVFNGEIYNYRELRDLYERAGARFQTASDTEVILEGFRLKGERVCEDLNGMFAFAIYDRDTGILFLARDRLGKKPLYWTRLNGVFCFASTLDAFRAVPGWRGTLDRDALAFFCIAGFFNSSRTIYADARAVPPGTWMRVTAQCAEPQTGNYWRLRIPAQKSGVALSSLIEQYESLLTDALRIRLRSDVPLALTFSGGVDSGTLAALCVKRLGIAPRCYTIDYHTKDDPSGETLTAERVSRELGVPWDHIQFDYHRDLLSDLDDLYSPFDQPCTQIGLVYSRRLYEAIRPYAKVVLTGNGADEIFTGYLGDARQAQVGRLLDLVRPIRPLAKSLRLPALVRETVPSLFAARLISRSSSELREGVEEGARALAEEALEAGAESTLDFKMFLSLRYSGSDSNFRLPDIAGLSAQVEVRSPYLDHRMVEFAAILPHRYKVDLMSLRPQSKYLPKRFYSRFVGRNVAFGPKRGMAWNVKYGMSIARDPRYRAAVQSSYDVLEECGVAAASFRSALERHTAHMLSKGPPSPFGREVMTGFMVGRWLQMKGVG